MDNMIHSTTDHTLSAPLVSIIMPAHNAAQFIVEALDSVLAQTYPHWELLVVDDASTDATGDIVQSYQTRDSRIQYERVTRIGSPAGVRNVALKKATGDFIAFLDADDLYYPDTLDKLLNQLVNFPKRTAVFGFPDYMDEYGEPLNNPIQLKSNSDGTYILPTNYKKTWREVVAGNVVCLLAALMLRRTTLNRIGFFNEDLCGPEDFQFYLKIYLDDFDGFHCYPDYVYRYRIHANSLTKTPENMERILNSSRKIMDWLFQDPRLPAKVHDYRSLAYVETYRYLGRERLLSRQPKLARKIAFKGFHNPNIHKKDWFTQCFPLIVRSFIPYSLNQFLVFLRWQIRNTLLNPPATSCPSWSST